MRTRTRVLVALSAAVLLGGSGFLAWTEGLPAYQRSQPVPAVAESEVLALPDQVYDPTEYVPATDKWGPPGPVGLVFRGRQAREGFTGEVDRPWYAVSARTGQYWRLAAPHLSQVGGRLWLDSAGTKVAWVWPGGVATYDTMTGAATTHDVPGADASTPLAWSPRSRRIAVGTDPVRVLDPSSGHVEVTDLRGASAASPPAWTADGTWVTVVSGGTIEAVEVDSAARRTVPVRVGRLRGAEWNSAGDVAGVHPTGNSINVLRIVRAPDLGRGDEATEVVDASPSRFSVHGFWGWADAEEVVLAGLRAETGAIEQAVTLSLPDNSLSTYMLFPTRGENWAGVRTVSLATDLLAEPTRAYEKPRMAWSPTAKLTLCMLLAVFPVLYFLIARRPRQP